MELFRTNEFDMWTRFQEFCILKAVQLRNGYIDVNVILLFRTHSFLYAHCRGFSKMFVSCMSLTNWLLKRSCQMIYTTYKIMHVAGWMNGGIGIRSIYNLLYQNFIPLFHAQHTFQIIQVYKSLTFASMWSSGCSNVLMVFLLNYADLGNT